METTAGSANWPRTVEVAMSTVFFSKFTHKRTVSKASFGCEIADEVAFEPRLKFLSPWLKAAEIMKFRRLHDSWREAYGRA